MSVDGVQDVEVDYAAKTATVTVNKDVSPAAVAGALTDGFTGTVKTP